MKDKAQVLLASILTLLIGGMLTVFLHSADSITSPNYSRENAPLLRAGAGGDRILARQTDSIGFTYFDRQTKYSMADRVSYDPARELLQVVWMAATDPQAETTRGSYFAVFDVNDGVEKLNDWDALRLGNDGWPSLALFSDGTVGIAAHTPAKFSRNVAPRTDAFVTNNAGGSSSFFPRVAIAADDMIHLIYTFITGSALNQLAYIRSDDGGLSWSDEILLTGPDAVNGSAPRTADFDTYAISARGEDVVVVYLDANFALHQRRSRNNGQSWEADRVLLEAEYERNFEIEPLDGNQVRYRTDTSFTPGRDLDVILDNTGVAHVVFPLLRTFLTGVGTKNGSTIDRSGRDTVNVDRGAFMRFGLGMLRDSDSRLRSMGLPNGSGWDGDGVFVSGNEFGSNYTRFPQWGIDEDNTLYCVYSSVKNGDHGPATIEGSLIERALYGHVYLTHSLGDGDWSLPLDLTPEGEDCLYGSLANTVGDRLFVAYQSGSKPGIQFGTEDALEINAVRLISLSVDELNQQATDVHEVPSAATDMIASARIIPNPINTVGILNFTTTAPGLIAINLFDARGRHVAELYRRDTSIGLHRVQIDSGMLGLAAGSYYCRISGPADQTSVMLIVP